MFFPKFFSLVTIFASIILAAGLITGCGDDIVSPELPSELAERQKARALPDSIPVTVELDMSNALRVGETVVTHPKLVNEGEETLPIVHSVSGFGIYVYRNDEIVYPKRERILLDGAVYHDLDPGEPYTYERSKAVIEDRGRYHAVAVLKLRIREEFFASLDDAAAFEASREEYQIFSEPVPITVH